MIAHSFVAMGDSFTEGLDDPYPDGSAYRGWSDLVAMHLATHLATHLPEETAEESARRDGHGHGHPPFAYANLAIRGKLFDAVVREQVPEGLAMRPDVFAFAAGGNDALRKGFDRAALFQRFDQTVEQLRETGAEFLLFRYVDMSRWLPGKRWLRPRIDAMNDGVAAVAERHGARLVDLWNDRGLDNPAMWSSDRLHLSQLGHRRVAAYVVEALGVSPYPTWLADHPAPKPLTWGAARTADARWAKDHLGPWLHRRLTGRSSGDTVTPKRPALAPLGEGPTPSRREGSSGSRAPRTCSLCHGHA